MDDDKKIEQAIYVTRPVLPELDDLNQLLGQVWESRVLTNGGDQLNCFERELKDYLSSPLLCAVSSGHAALETAIRALDLRGEVITTPFTFPSTTHALHQCNLQPVFCDVLPGQANIDPDQIERSITADTSAILAVHVYGFPCDVARIEAIASRHKLKVIYDAAHAFGVTENGVPIASFGDASIFSLHATKVLHSIEGGLVLSPHADLIERVASIRNFGYSDSSESPLYIGTNAKLSELHAAVGRLNLKTIDANIVSRKAIYTRYVEHLGRSEGLQFLVPPESCGWNYAYCPMIVGNDGGQLRERLSEVLAAHGIYPRKYFYPLVTEMDCYRDHGFYLQSFPEAKKLSDTVLCLPIYPELELQQVDRICDIVSATLKDAI